MLKKADLADTWRMKNPSSRQFTCVVISDAQVSAARLDRFYISGSFITVQKLEEEIKRLENGSVSKSTPQTSLQSKRLELNSSQERAKGACQGTF